MVYQSGHYITNKNTEKFRASYRSLFRQNCWFSVVSLRFYYLTVLHWLKSGESETPNILAINLKLRCANWYTPLKLTCTVRDITCETQPLHELISLPFNRPYHIIFSLKYTNNIYCTIYRSQLVRKQASFPKSKTYNSQWNKMNQTGNNDSAKTSSHDECRNTQIHTFSTFHRSKTTVTI